MFKKALPVALVILAVVGGLFYYNYAKQQATPKTKTDIRIGWQIPWATQGQLTQVLKNTDLLEKNGLKGDFKGFTFGPPINEAALAGNVDVVFTADQPAATLLSKSSDWVIVGRLMYNRVSLYVPPQSDIKEVADLKGKKVAMPFGAAAQRMVLKAEKDAGLDPKKDVSNVNLGILEQNDLVKDPSVKKWGEIDALGGFDPTPAMFEEKGLARNIKEGKIVSVILMNKKFIEKNPDAPVNFLKAFEGAYKQYRDNVAQANNWFKTEAKLNVSDVALDASAAIEPNVNKKNKIYLDFTDEDYTIMQEAADFLKEQGLLKEAIVMKDHVDLSYLKKAQGKK